MFAEPLEEYEVVYFIFPYKAAHSFWNKNVDFSLSLAFLNKDYKILDIKDMQANSEKSCVPKSNNVQFVVEANQGMFEKLNIKIGDKLVLKGKKLILNNHLERRAQTLESQEQVQGVEKRLN